MSKICTDLNQSRKLIELGIDINTADMCYRYKWYNNNFIPLPCAEKAKEPITGDTPCWSLSALLELMPKNVEIERTHIGWRCDYYTNDDALLKYGEDKDNPLDAVFEMICWLKENKKT